MRKQRLQLLALSLILAALVLVAIYGPEPENANATTFSEDEIARWTVPPQDTGAVIEDWAIVSAYLIVPVDTANPCGEAIAIDLLSGEVCALPAETEEPTYY